MSALRPPASSWFPIPGLTFGFWRRSAQPARPVSAAAKATLAKPQVDFDRILAGVRATPQLEMIEWAGDGSAPVRPQESAPACEIDDDGFDAGALDARRRKIRDRYIAARFPGIAKSAADLTDEEEVIRAARLLFEDERADDAIELLELAIEERPASTGAWLARLEILYLVRDAGAFAESARAFRARHGGDTQSWNEICRLGRALAPHETLFDGELAVRDHEHYGPWPHTPNWIRAPWDLTAEVAAVDFHHALERSCAAQAASRA
jgi:hypothetical protein